MENNQTLWTGIEQFPSVEALLELETALQVVTNCSRVSGATKNTKYKNSNKNRIRNLE